MGTKKQSAGILPFKFTDDEMFFFIVHPGGPFFSNKNNGYWGIVKGELEDGEEALAAAIREFKEETSNDISGEFIELDAVTLKSGKTIYAWAVEMTRDFKELKSNHFVMEWPPKSGSRKSFPEIDNYEWCNKQDALLKMSPAQAPLLYDLLKKLGRH